MTQFKNAMEVFQLLDKSNCKKCNEPTCLAFAAAVIQGKRPLGDCPSLDARIAAQYTQSVSRGPKIDQDMEQLIADLQKEVEQIDLNEAAERLGGVYKKGRLTLKILGKDLSIDPKGQFYTDLHVHGWIAGPVLNYILHGKGLPVSKKWVPLRELPGGKDWYRLFGQRCEKPIKKVADTYTDFFEDMVHLFSGSQIDSLHESDISVILYALPKIPILICYWRPEDGLESNLHLFFDETAEANLNIESLYTLGAGLALMFEKLSYRHA